MPMSKSYLTVDLPGHDVIMLNPCPRYHLSAIEAILGYLLDRWLIKNGDLDELLSTEPECWALFQRAVNLCPRLDIPGSYGFDVHQLNSEQLLPMFFGQQDSSGQWHRSKLMELHHYEPLPLPDWRQQTDREPIPTTDDPEIDLLAMLSQHYTASDAIQILHTLNARQLDRLVWALAELNRNPDEREQDGLARDFAAWKQENQQEYREAMGLAFNFPTDDGNSGSK